MDFKKFIKGRIGTLLLLFIIPFFFCYLIPFPYYFISIAISWIGSVIVLYYRAKEEQALEKLYARKGFIVSFFAQLCQQATFKQAYEISIKYLNSFFQLHTYEEMIEDPSLYDLDKEELFLYALGKEKKNEGMLSNYSLLYESKVKEYDELNEVKEKRNKNYKLYLLLFGASVFALTLIFVLYPNIKNSLNSFYYLIGSIIGLSLPLPLIEVDIYTKVKKENYA